MTGGFDDRALRPGPNAVVVPMPRSSGFRYDRTLRRFVEQGTGVSVVSQTADRETSESWHGFWTADDEPLYTLSVQSRDWPPGGTCYHVHGISRPLGTELVLTGPERYSILELFAGYQRSRSLHLGDPYLEGRVTEDQIAFVVFWDPSIEPRR